ncbi:MULTISPECIES: DUF4350 domain-containing protein [unclassified Isoptericola]|uniref:DUF4350 domain-containing protein n=1 Tax=unclassified Isoptericola TaxID=2623355 RepID=UPI002713A24C|nr:MULTISPECIES: DUF4350 domain-containing protein [unclassified Isoptericola]MDO8144162.1 DUF4350 domain-containing protein [Isoptericola sp. 178]MDO8148016.1 DUF4350 domain-containing protein [Isoptericola sp. b515]MDO8151491.1 DUF4350 domain-containing protein [Isoptericola sp. b408]
MPATETTGTWTSTATGDGSTLGSRTRRRWRRVRWTLLVLLSLAALVAVLALLRPPTSTTPYDVENTRDDGSRALAQVLQQQGVSVVQVDRVDDAVAAAGPGTTVLVPPSPFLRPEQAELLATAAGDVVVAEAGRALLEAVSGGTIALDEQASAPEAPRPAECDAPAAVAAGPSRLAPGLLVAGDLVAGCWPVPDGRQVALATTVRDGRSVTAVADAAFLRNGDVLTDGNAALALHLLGAQERLVWLVQHPADDSALGGTSPSGPGAPGEGAGLLDLVPPWFAAVAWWALLVAAVAAVWRARRLGPLLVEDLPVVVPAAEATRGRGRLYRRARSRGHAAAALRAATADRIARRLGLPRSAGGDTVVAAVERATGRDPHDVSALLYGSPPADDVALTELARRLDTLESEVHRP